jgi:hypothetical protein
MAGLPLVPVASSGMQVGTSLGLCLLVTVRTSENLHNLHCRIVAYFASWHAVTLKEFVCGPRLQAAQSLKAAKFFGGLGVYALVLELVTSQCILQWCALA